MRHFYHLTHDDRIKIEALLKEKHTPKEIANNIGCHISTIYRELKRGRYEHRNSDWTTEERYSPDIADEKYRENLAAKGPGLKIGNDIEVVDPEEVEIGDIIVVKPGERVPLDGIVIEGSSMVDTSALTGESVLRSVNVEDEVLSGFINKNALLTIEVTKDFGESAVSKVLDLVENASSKKAKTENFISVFSKYYTPVVVALAAIISIIPPMIIDISSQAVWYDWVLRGLTFLVVSCPCALVLSIPLTFFSGIGFASKNGVLIKGSNYLEALRYVDTVVFDKTGTLTKGVFNVTKVNAVNVSEDELMEYAAYAEANSNHPIAKSIVKAYNKELDLSKIGEYEEIAAHGIKVNYNGKTVLAGNEKLMNVNKKKYTPVTETGTVVYIAINGKYAGDLEIGRAHV